MIYSPCGSVAPLLDLKNLTISQFLKVLSWGSP